MAENKAGALDGMSELELEDMRVVAESTGFSKGHSLAEIVDTMNRKVQGQEGEVVGLESSESLPPSDPIDEAIERHRRLEAFKKRIREGLVVARAGK